MTPNCKQSSGQNLSLIKVWIHLDFSLEKAVLNHLIYYNTKVDLILQFCQQ